MYNYYGFRYLAIFVTVREATREMSKTSTRNTNDIALAKKLVIIVATDFLCWVRHQSLAFS